MPLFKPALQRFRRHPAKYAPSLSIAEGDPMSPELNKLIATDPDLASRKLLVAEMQSFLTIYNRYISQPNQNLSLDWTKVSPPSEQRIVRYETLSGSPTDALSKLAILKVNGGMNGAKSALEVQSNLSFLDLIIQQVDYLNTTERAKVPLLLMTSFNTEADTLRVIKTYANRPVAITTFNQSRYPRLLKDSMLPFAKNVRDEKAVWYPPGHGDLYNSLNRSGVLDRLLAEGKEYLFVSNSDNLGAIVDKRILQYMIEQKSEFIMEVTSKIKGDIQGGTLIDYDGSLRLLEASQVPSNNVDDFNARKFKFFNTNNLWINLKALKRVLGQGEMSLDIMPRSRTLEDGRTVLQLETAAGSAIQHFQNALGVHVPRSRFLPVKTTSDLLLVKSDLYNLEHGRLVMNKDIMFGIPPVIKLGDHFRKIHHFQRRFKQIPNILELDHLTIAGDVYFGRNVVLRGTVIITATEGQCISIPDGCILENRLVSGNLNMIEL
ncbi:hypothetical protein D9619_001934 [Psilocybe cf. subviscida]|uniref:UTP--glucose-1-phosphate uridylyltransferase n=1 Tax=Psilocybe cf. subviscida TaxID=2480587 RepID=A0A8H5F2X1_9AGAR|nr:hypothetical protein D9619_001934 [Psilocybe cf. subviscida]